MTTIPVHRPTAPHGLLPGASPHVPTARRFEVRRGHGHTTYVPLTDLARAWGLDYRALRDFVRDHSGVRSEKLALANPDRPGESATLIVIEAAALGALSKIVRSSLPRA